MMQDTDKGRCPLGGYQDLSPKDFLKLVHDTDRDTEYRLAWGRIPPRFVMGYQRIYLSSLECQSMRDLYAAWCRYLPIAPLSEENMERAFLSRTEEKSLLVYTKDLFPACEKIDIRALHKKCRRKNIPALARSGTEILDCTQGIREGDPSAWEQMIAWYDRGYTCVAVTDDTGQFAGTVPASEFRMKFPSVELAIHRQYYVPYTEDEDKLKQDVARCLVNARLQDIPVVREGDVLAWGARKTWMNLLPACRVDSVFPAEWNRIGDEAMQKFLRGRRRVLVSSLSGPLAGFKERFSGSLDIECLSPGTMERYFDADFDIFLYGMDLYPVGRIPKYDARQLYADLLVEEAQQYLARNHVAYVYYDLSGSVQEADYRIRLVTEASPLSARKLSGSGNRYYAHIDMHDVRGVNFFAGRRATRESLQGRTRHRIYIFGICTASGGFARTDSETVSSFLQELLDQANVSFQAVNCGVTAGAPMISGDINSLCYLLDTEFCPGDIVIHMGRSLWNSASALPLKNRLDAAECLNALPNRELRCIHYNGVALAHVDATGYRLMARQIFEYLAGSGLCERQAGQAGHSIPSFFSRMPSKAAVDSEELQDFLRQLSLEKADAVCAGAIVMNCNPFTRGHLHLVKAALCQVDFLYVFVVEEDASEISFQDRFAMARLNCAQFPNVKVLPSGRYMISALTFGEYFHKDALQSQAIHPAMDVTIFASRIAPALGIQKRFVGEEPLDRVTRQYNAAMKELLPRYGIELVEIPRLALGSGTPINATAVRRCMKDGNLQACQDFLTQQSYEHLMAENGQEILRKGETAKE